MMFDSYYSIGKSHEVCEDYALHTDNVGVLADGCSSAPNTDVGARLLCHSSISNNLNSSIHVAESARKILGLPELSLASTIVRLTEDKCGVVTVEYFGDCIVVAINKEGDRKIYSVTFPKETPYYPCYVLQNQHDQYIKEIGREFSLNEWKCIIFPSSNKMIFEPVSWDDGELDSVFVFSDGVRSFTKSGESMPETEFLNRFFPLKNWVGKFAARRMKKVLSELAKDGWENQDDMSVIGWKY